MNVVRSSFRNSRRHGSGGTLLEYALGLIVVTGGVLAACQLFGGRLNQLFANLAHSIAGAF